MVGGSPRFYALLSQKMSERYYPDDKREYRFAQGFTVRTDSVLDVGAGWGAFGERVQGRYVGLDPNPAAIDSARRQGRMILPDSIEDHAVAHVAEYSVVVAFQVLEHVTALRGFVTACLKTLAPGGLLIVSVPSHDSFVASSPNAILNVPPHHVSRWSDAALVNLGDLFGLEVVALDHEPLAPMHRRGYAHTMASRFVLKLARPLLKERNTLIDNSIGFRMANKLAWWLSCVYLVRLHTMTELPRGHSVTVVYRKTRGRAIGPAQDLAPQDTRGGRGPFGRA
jgi:SAM-dependent methyltransferase